MCQISASSSVGGRGGGVREKPASQQFGFTEPVTVATDPNKKHVNQSNNHKRVSSTYSFGIHAALAEKSSFILFICIAEIRAAFLPNA